MSTMRLAVHSLVAALLINHKALAGPVSGGDDCKCIPSDSCWPSASTWAHLNTTVGGNLIASVPVAAPCYQGPLYDAATCAAVQANWTDSPFQANHPIGYIYPHAQSCDIPGGNTTTCSLGDSPVYAIQALSSDHVVAAVKFAKENNVRLVIKMTGHDLLARSTGYGSLEIWLRHLRKGVTFQQTYKPSKTCRASDWTGSAIAIGGGYSWSDVYPVAQANKVVVVGGGCPSVGCLGGYTQGGGHSLANHEFGLGADQLLEAQVVLASGDIVTVSACENRDLWRALRGGGPGTYGVVVSGVVKAYPDVTVAGQTLFMAPFTSAQIPQFMDALAILYQAFPELSDGGLSGYGSWMAYSPVLVAGAFSSYFTWSFGGFNKTIDEITALFAPTAAKLAPYNGTSLVISATYQHYNTYFDYYYGTNGVNSAGESEAALVSRLLGKEHLANTAGLKQMLNVTAGAPYEFTFNEICLVGGGAVLDASDDHSGVNPAWRKTYLVNEVARGWLNTADAATVAAAHQDITYHKGAAMTTLAPDMGSYMNEGDWQDPNYLQNYYGDALPGHEDAKRRYDPNGIFYCPTCVGSEKWTQTSDGHLCRIQS